MGLEGIEQPAAPSARLSLQTAGRSANATWPCGTRAPPPVARALVLTRLCLSKPFWDPILGGFVNAPTKFGTYFSGHWDVHWGYDLDFDPSPPLTNCFCFFLRASLPIQIVGGQQVKPQHKRSQLSSKRFRPRLAVEKKALPATNCQKGF